MKTLRLLSFCLLLQAADVQAESIAFVNVNVLPMTTETVLPGRTVIVGDGRIMAIGDVEDTVLPDGAMVVDGTDRYLMPGLAEMHGHVTGTSPQELDRLMGLYLANGVTTVRGMLGRPSHLKLREQLRGGQVIGPRLISSGPSFNGNSVDSPEQASAMVREQHAAGYDFLKIHPGLSREEFDAIAATAKEFGIPFAGHVPEDVGVPRALEAGIASIDHLDGYMATLMPANYDRSGGFGGFFGLFIAAQADAGKIGDIAARTAEAGVWNVPTESLFEHVASTTRPEVMVGWPEMKYMPAAQVRRWRESKEDLINDPQFDAVAAVRAIEIRRQLILALHEAGAGLLLGSDSPQIFNVPGFSLHRELEFLVAAELSPYEALRTGTVNPAVFLGKENEFGQVKVGLDADLVLLDANPLDDISNSRRVHGVMLRSRWFSRQQLDEQLARIARRANGPAT